MYHIVWGYVLFKKLFSLPVMLQLAFFFFYDSVFEILLHKYVTILFSQSSVGGQLSGFQLFTVTNNLIPQWVFVQMLIETTMIRLWALNFCVGEFDNILICTSPKVLPPSLKASWEIEWAPGWSGRFPRGELFLSRRGTGRVGLCQAPAPPAHSKAAAPGSPATWTFFHAAMLLGTHIPGHSLSLLH